MSESRFNRVGWFDDHQSTPSKKPPEPTTAAGRALHTANHRPGEPANHHGLCDVEAILAIEAEARAAALDEARAAVEGVPSMRRSRSMDVELYRLDALAAIDALRVKP